jgi:DNA-directed RNA polymerase specialized sigma24 family protein
MLLFVVERLVHLFGETARHDPPQEEVIALCGHADDEVRTWALRILSDRAYTRFHEFDGLLMVEDLTHGCELARTAARRDPDDEFAAGERQSHLIRMVRLELSERDREFMRLRGVHDREMERATAALAVPAAMLG